LGFLGFFRPKREQSANEMRRIYADDGETSILDIISL
jgi:hypothetical protein